MLSFSALAAASTTSVSNQRDMVCILCLPIKGSEMTTIRQEMRSLILIRPSFQRLFSRPLVLRKGGAVSLGYLKHPKDIS